MRDVLSEIVAHKRKEVKEAKERVSLHTLEKRLQENPPPVLSMEKALRESNTGVIAEFKRKSPAKGWIAPDAGVAKIAVDYVSAGASALSVLTDEKFFGGNLADLQTAAQNVKIPVMRKEFIINEYQIVEARIAGASAILLIAAVLTARESARLTDFASQLGMEVLLELHNEDELDYIAPQNRLIGINNRNLETFVTSVEKSYRIIEKLPKNAIWVSESGISDPETVKELRKAGYKGFLIGENFMKTDNPGASLLQFINEIRQEE